uniref:Uncharacterized protein n=1 Tax=Anguilla anguilla TaxID=7936 RepID=A0A0E9VE86_ANGAN
MGKAMLLDKYFTPGNAKNVVKMNQVVIYSSPLWYFHRRNFCSFSTVVA